MAVCMICTHLITTISLFKSIQNTLRRKYKKVVELVDHVWSVGALTEVALQRHAYNNLIESKKLIKSILGYLSTHHPECVLNIILHGNNYENGYVTFVTSLAQIYCV